MLSNKLYDGFEILACSKQRTIYPGEMFTEKRKNLILISFLVFQSFQRI